MAASELKDYEDCVNEEAPDSTDRHDSSFRVLPADCGDISSHHLAALAVVPVLTQVAPTEERIGNALTHSGRPDRVAFHPRVRTHGRAPCQCVDSTGRHEVQFTVTGWLVRRAQRLKCIYPGASSRVAYGFDLSDTCRAAKIAAGAFGPLALPCAARPHRNMTRPVCISRRRYIATLGRISRRQPILSTDSKCLTANGFLDSHYTSISS